MDSDIIIADDIKSKILTIRGMQVMLDRDLAVYYRTETRVLKQAVKRNIERFPADFMFELSDSDIGFMVSRSVIPSKKYLGGAKPYAFTEQGVAMLSAVLKSPIAIEASIEIIRAFIDMKRYIQANSLIINRIDNIEFKQVQAESKFNQIFSLLEEYRSIPPKSGLFFNGQIFDAYNFVADLIRSAENSIILIDNYVDDSVLTLFSKRNPEVKVKIYTKHIPEQLKLDLQKFNSQYDAIEIIQFSDAHDRFLIIDNEHLYHFGASLKDLGKKWFAFSKMELGFTNIMEKLDV